MSELHKFLFDGLPVRGLLVRLTHDWQDVLKRRGAAHPAWPAPVRALMGELAAAGVLMQSNIKFEGTLVLQVQGDGPVKLAVAEVQSDLTFRVTAKVVGETPEDATLAPLVNAGGQGRCAITLDPKTRAPGAQPYQGVVGLNNDHGEPLDALSQVLEHYMLQSEQLDTKLVLAANDEVAAGLLIQRLPLEGEGNLGRRAEDDIGMSEAYNRIAHLAATLTREELLALDAQTVLRRLFWDEALTHYEPRAPRFACTCSRGRVGSMLKGLGAPEVNGIVAEQGRVEIDCEFCGARYHFDPVDVGELFTPPGRQAPGSSSLN